MPLVSLAFIVSKSVRTTEKGGLAYRTAAKKVSLDTSAISS